MCPKIMTSGIALKYKNKNKKLNLPNVENQKTKRQYTEINLNY